MSKRKTRKEKIIADLRRKLATTSFDEPAKSTPTSYSIVHPQTNISIVLSHQYLKKDLLKTFFLTSGIIAVELILFIFSKK